VSVPGTQEVDHETTDTVRLEEGAEGGLQCKRVTKLFASDVGYN
jgi:hypothetical protein